MAIIAILASVILVGGSQAINAAKRAKASYTATQVQTAIMNYYTEYGVYPVPAGTTSEDFLYGSAAPTTVDTNETQLTIALCGNVNPYTASADTSTVSNTRNITYLTPKKNEVDTNGTLITPFSSGTTYYYYWIAVDSDYSGVLGDSGTAKGAMPDFSSWTSGSTSSATVSGLTQGVAVWADCDTSNLAAPASSTAPAYWIHTY